MRSPMVDAARARARAARGERTSAGTIENPVLGYQLENAAFPGTRSLAGMLPEHMTMASLPLAGLYQRGARVAQADAAVRVADAEARSTGQRIALDAARAYYRAAMSQVSAEVADNLTRWLDSVVVYNRTRVQQGVTAEADLIRSELERDRALADAGMQDAELARARAALSMFLGDPGGPSLAWRVSLDDTLLAIPVDVTRAVADPVATVHEAAEPAGVARFTDVGRRPDVIAARERLAAAAAGVSLEKRLRLRSLGAMVGVKGSGGMNSMMAGLSVPLPLFDQNRGELTRARAQRDAAGFELEAQSRSARAELLGAQEAARLLTERAGTLARRDPTGVGALYLTRADAARTIALGAYREGAVPLLQVLDAARAWGEARLAYYRTLYAQHEAVLALLVARGDDLLAALPALTPASSRGQDSR